MAYSTNFRQIEQEFAWQNSRWPSIDVFEAYWLRRQAETRGEPNWYTDRNGTEMELPCVNHFPTLKEYEVYMEGYAATGESGEAHLWGKALARNFAEACHKVSCENYLKSIAKSETTPQLQYGIGRWDYDPNKLSYWGCKLHWDLAIASKSFG